MFGLTSKETATLRKFSTPRTIQDFLDQLPINFEKHGDTHMSPRRVLRERKAHCVEGALLAQDAAWGHVRVAVLFEVDRKLVEEVLDFPGAGELAQGRGLFWGQSEHEPSL